MQQSLGGLRILNTRPREQAKALSSAIIQAGGVVLECPTLEIRPTDTAWLELLPPWAEVGYAIFVSSLAVKFFFAQCPQSWPAHIKVIAIGKGTRKALQAHGIRVDESPTIPDSEHLLQCASLQALDNTKTLLLCKGVGGRDLIEEQLRLKGAKLLALDLYTRHLPAYSPSALQALWQNDLVDIILLSSEQSIHNLCLMLGESGCDWLRNNPVLVLSQRLADIAAGLGIRDIRICPPHDILAGLQAM
jgi:uroporphyrinogen-III synthase